MWDLTRLAITIITTMKTTLSIKNLMDRETDRQKAKHRDEGILTGGEQKKKSYPIKDFYSNKKCTNFWFYTIVFGYILGLWTSLPVSLRPWHNASDPYAGVFIQLIVTWWKSLYEGLSRTWSCVHLSLTSHSGSPELWTKGLYSYESCGNNCCAFRKR